MQHRFLVLAALVSASACAALASACGGTESTNGDGGDATTADAPDDSSSPADTGPGDVANDATPPNDAAPDGGCSGAGCRACCAAAHPDAAAFFEATEESCACTTPGDCKTPCAASLCTGKQPMAQSKCEACVLDKEAGACFAAAAMACTADVACQAFAGCVAGCGGGPADAGGGG